MQPPIQQGTIYQQARQHAEALPPLLSEALLVAQTVQAGPHGLRRSGYGGEFWQFREYQGGESAALIDWKQSSRTDKIYVREREKSSFQRCNIWIDTSGSMHYKSLESLPSKAESAHIILLALSYLLLRGGENVSWMAWIESNPALISGQGNNALDRLAWHILPIEKSQHGLPPPLQIARYSNALFCSDFLAPREEWHERVKLFMEMNVHGILLHIVDPQEASPNFGGRLRVEGCEGERPVSIPNATAIMDEYVKRWDEHVKFIKSLAEKCGWRYLKHCTADNPSVTLTSLCEILGGEFAGHGYSGAIPPYSSPSWGEGI